MKGTLTIDVYNTNQSLYMHRSIVKARSQMQKIGITHILNSAQGEGEFQVNTNENMYKKVGMQYYGIEAIDHMNFPLSSHFQQTTDFIETGLSTGGKVMVNCRMGASRSASIVIAYLMMHHRFNVRDATRLVRAKREICPNDGFLQQLCDLNESLKKAGHFKQLLVKE